jgi:hypothetical protein
VSVQDSEVVVVRVGALRDESEVVVVRVGVPHECDCKIIPKFSGGGGGECGRVAHGLMPERPGSLSSFGPGTLEMETLLDEHECSNCVRLRIVSGWSLACQTCMN